MSIDPILKKYRGSLLGLAAGDALGTTLEFKPPGTFKPITDMLGGGPFNLRPGQWTDDTSMALCLAESLVEKQEFDPVDQLERYTRWYKEGHLSSTGRCFDIGMATADALNLFLQKRCAVCGSSDPRSAGNGSLMRLAPVPLFFAQKPRLAIEKSGDSSTTTHAVRTCIDACKYYGGLIAGIIRGASKEEVLSPYYSPVPGYWKTSPLIKEIDEIAAGSFKTKEPPEITGTGYVVKSLEAALWAFYKSNTFKDGALMAVNLGNDADTTGAIYGMLAGAFYGEEAIPLSWRDKLAMKDVIIGFTDTLYSLSKTLV